MSTADVRGSTPGTLRLLNSRAILDALIRSDGPQTVTALGGEVGISRPTVEAALADLVEEGWAVEGEMLVTPGRAGRPAKQFAFDATAGFVLGVDLGPYGIVAILADLRGASITTIDETYDSLADPDHAWSVMQDLLGRLTADIDVGRVLAVTYGVPGVVDASGEIRSAVVVPEWMPARIPTRLAELFPGAATAFDNDAKLAASAEATWGRLAGIDDGLYLVMGRQLGAAIIVNGRLARGARGAAGEVGGLSTTGWSTLTEELERRIPDGSDLEACLAAAAAGEPASIDVLEWLASAVADGVAQLVAAIDPARVVVGGDVVTAAESFATRLAAEVANRTGSAVETVPSTLGREAVACGALARSLAHVRTVRMRLG